MSIQYDKSQYYIDFSDHDHLTNNEKKDLEMIQNTFRPIERVEFLSVYRMEDKITADEFETMTGLPYNFTQ